MPPHLSNFAFIETLGKSYDYFIFHSSNDLFVQHGVAQYIQQYDAGFALHYLPQKYTYWWPCERAWTDSGLEACMETVGQTRYVASQVEGSFYRMGLMRTVMTTIQNCVDNGTVDLEADCAREETFFATIAECLVDRERVGRPYVFSEVHRFDRELWNEFRKADEVYSQWLHLLLPRRLYDKGKSIYNDWKFKKGKYETTPEIVDRVRNRDTKYIEKNRYLYDGAIYFELYGEANTLFAVKRVKREYNDPLRSYIRNLPD